MYRRLGSDSGHLVWPRNQQRLPSYIFEGAILVILTQFRKANLIRSPSASISSYLYKDGVCVLLSSP